MRLADRIEGAIQRALSVEVPSHDADLIESGLIDSLALVTLIAEIEQEFGIELPLDGFDVESFRTVDQMATFVESAGAVGEEAT